MPQVYNLDLEMMLSTLARRQLSGSLTADIPRGRVGRDVAHIEIIVDNGKIISCLLQSEQNRFVGASAIQMIVQLGVVPWTFAVATKQPSMEITQPSVPAIFVPQARIPRRLVVLQAAELAQLPRTHFHVYAYIDGQRTVEEIARLLRVGPKRIESILFDLQRWQVIQ